MALTTVNARRSLLGLARPGLAMQPLPTGAIDTASERRLFVYLVSGEAAGSGELLATLAPLAFVATGVGGLVGRATLALAPLGAVSTGTIGRVAHAAITLAPLGLVAGGTGPPPGPRTGEAFLFFDELRCFALGRGPEAARPPWTIPEAGGHGTVRVIRRRRW